MKDEKTAKLIAKGMTENKTFDIMANMRIEDLRIIIGNEFSIPPSQLIITYKNRVIKNGDDSQSLYEVFDFTEKYITVNIKWQKNRKIIGGAKESGIEAMLKNPMVKGMLKNPESIKMIKKMFPDASENNREVDLLLNSGHLEDEMQKMAEDDDYFSTQMRNADIAMAKLENLPGGLNMMSSYLKGLSPSTSNLFSKSKTFNVGTQRAPSDFDKKGSSSKDAVITNPYIEYRSQNATLLDIGYKNVRENYKALIQSKGDIGDAMEILNNRSSFQME